MSLLIFIFLYNRRELPILNHFRHFIRDVFRNLAPGANVFPPLPLQKKKKTFPLTERVGYYLPVITRNNSLYVIANIFDTF